MTTILEDTGERMIPVHHKGKNIYGAHLGRYQAGAGLVKGKIVLDIACGSGYGTKLMSKQAKAVFGVDVDKDTIKYAKENYASKNITYLLGDGTSIPLKDNTVDVVVSYETIEHIENYTKFMEEVKRVLKPNGQFLLSTPNDIEYAEGNHFHIHQFNFKELKALAGKFFKYQKDYFQTIWMCSTILPEDLQTSEWTQEIQTTNTVSLKPDQCIYFFMICSDRKIDVEIKPQGVIGEHWRQRDQQARALKHNNMMETINKYKNQIQKLNKIIDNKDNEISKIYNSRTWKIANTLGNLKLIKNKK